MKDFDPLIDPPPPPMRYICSGPPGPIVVSDSIYRLLQRSMAEARKKAEMEEERRKAAYDVRNKAGNPT